MVQFKKELLKEGSGIRCFNALQAKVVVGWFHENGIKWDNGTSSCETYWGRFGSDFIDYIVYNGKLRWAVIYKYKNAIDYNDALLSPDDEKLKDYQKIEPEPEPEFKVGDRVKWFYGSDIGNGVIREIKNNRFLVEYFSQSMRWFSENNLIKIGHDYDTQ